MKTSELRIGNLFIEKHSKKLISVLELLRGGNIVFDFEYYGVWQAEPIPLTKELLIKFGFNFTIDTWYLKGFALWEVECSDEKGNEEMGFFYELREVGIMDMHVEYVHQLQNLYFALTGEELTIKEL